MKCDDILCKTIPNVTTFPHTFFSNPMVASCFSFAEDSFLLMLMASSTVKNYTQIIIDNAMRELQWSNTVTTRTYTNNKI